MKIKNVSGAARRLPALRLTVPDGAVIEVPQKLGEQLLAQSLWASAKVVAAPDPVIADTPAEEETA